MLETTSRREEDSRELGGWTEPDDTVGADTSTLDTLGSTQWDSTNNDVQEGHHTSLKT